ncbi:MAG: autotransporter-associated beta strand repeat-containing protein [Burkholderiales bacterium]|nr:autotransporter-associated beta strand repeat-containing protein [Opitutaceae bacterium]
MRRLLLLTASLLALSASAQEKWVESPVTLTLTLSSAGEQTLKPGRAVGTATRTVPLLTSRLGNKQILEALVTNGDIPEIKGWRLVAIWAFWPDEDPYAGNAYRFYARKGSGDSLQTVAIPSSILSVEPLVASVGVNHRIQGEQDTILSGSETYKVFTRLRFAVAGVAAGDPHGILSGTGKYKKIAGQVAARYVPDSSKATVAGLFSHDGENNAGVVGGSIAFGAGKFVTAYDYVAPSGTTYSGTVTISAGSLNFENVQIGALPATSSRLVKNGAGTLTLSGENTYTGVTTVSSGTTLGGSGTVTGTTTVSSGVTLGGSGVVDVTAIGSVGSVASTRNAGFVGASIQPGTLHLNGEGTLVLNPSATGITFTLTPDSTGTIAFSSGGMLELANGTVLTFVSGQSFGLSTLTLEQTGTGITLRVPPATDTPAPTAP